MASSTAGLLKGESGLEFLLRMRAREEYSFDEFGTLSTSDFVLLSTPCCYTKASAVNKIISYTIMPAVYGGLDRRVLLLDLVNICVFLLHVYVQSVTPISVSPHAGNESW